MEASELTIGDWVMSPKGKGRIDTIQDNDVVFIDSIQGIDGAFDVDEIKPIPLTKEILEKNGFHKEWDEDIILMVCDNIIVEIGDMYKIYKDGKMYFRRVLAPLYYVHQLQHALRLCGINKEIQL